jgi:Zn-dependent oligopeptidase
LIKHAKDKIEERQKSISASFFNLLRNVDMRITDLQLVEDAHISKPQSSKNISNETIYRISILTVSPTAKLSTSFKHVFIKITMHFITSVITLVYEKKIK